MPKRLRASNEIHAQLKNRLEQEHLRDKISELWRKELKQRNQIRTEVLELRQCLKEGIRNTGYSFTSSIRDIPDNNNNDSTPQAEWTKPEISICQSVRGDMQCVRKPRKPWTYFFNNSSSNQILCQPADTRISTFQNAAFSILVASRKKVKTPRDMPMWNCQHASLTSANEESKWNSRDDWLEHVSRKSKFRQTFQNISPEHEPVTNFSILPDSNNQLSIPTTKLNGVMLNQDPMPEGEATCTYKTDNNRCSPPKNDFDKKRTIIGDRKSLNVVYNIKRDNHGYSKEEKETHSKGPPSKELPSKVCLLYASLRRINSVQANHNQQIKATGDKGNNANDKKAFRKAVYAATECASQHVQTDDVCNPSKMCFNKMEEPKCCRHSTKNILQPWGSIPEVEPQDLCKTEIYTSSECLDTVGNNTTPSQDELAESLVHRFAPDEEQQQSEKRMLNLVSLTDLDTKDNTTVSQGHSNNVETSNVNGKPVVTSVNVKKNKQYRTIAVLSKFGNVGQRRKLDTRCMKNTTTCDDNQDCDAIIYGDSAWAHKYPLVYHHLTAKSSLNLSDKPWKNKERPNKPFTISESITSCDRYDNKIDTKRHPSKQADRIIYETNCLFPNGRGSSSRTNTPSSPLVHMSAFCRDTKKSNLIFVSSKKMSGNPTSSNKMSDNPTSSNKMSGNPTSTNKMSDNSTSSNKMSDNSTSMNTSVNTTSDITTSCGDTGDSLVKTVNCQLSESNEVIGFWSANNRKERNKTPFASKTRQHVSFSSLSLNSRSVKEVSSDLIARKKTLEEPVIANEQSSSGTQVKHYSAEEKDGVATTNSYKHDRANVRCENKPKQNSANHSSNFNKTNKKSQYLKVKFSDEENDNSSNCFCGQKERKSIFNDKNIEQPNRNVPCRYFQQKMSGNKFFWNKLRDSNVFQKVGVFVRNARKLETSRSEIEYKEGGNSVERLDGSHVGTGLQVQVLEKETLIGTKKSEKKVLRDVVFSKRARQRALARMVDNHQNRPVTDMANMADTLLRKRIEQFLT